MRLSTLFISLWTVGHTSGKFPELWRSRMPLSTLFIVYGQWVIHLENFPNYGDLVHVNVCLTLTSTFRILRSVSVSMARNF